MDQARIILDCLDKFCTISGQNINYQKSGISFLPNASNIEVEQICSVIGMPKTEDLSKYLGVPTINGRVTRATYQEVIARVDSKLAGWKAICL